MPGLVGGTVVPGSPLWLLEARLHVHLGGLTARVYTPGSLLDGVRWTVLVSDVSFTRLRCGARLLRGTLLSVLYSTVTCTCI